MNSVRPDLDWTCCKQESEQSICSLSTFWRNDMKHAPMVTMTEVQPQLTRLLQDLSDPTPVRLGRSHLPVVALAPWPCYLAWQKTLNQEQPGRLVEEEKSISQAGRLFLSYRHRVAPLLASNEQAIHAIVIKVRKHAIGAILNWQDLLRFYPGDIPYKDSPKVATVPKRTFTIVIAHKHLSQFPEQFAREQALGGLAPIIHSAQ